MKRIRSLNLCQKALLILMLVMIGIFSVIYPLTIAREGYAYKGSILAAAQEGDSTVYSGNIQGKQARFTVSEDRTVVFQYGDTAYGPYTAREDPTAIPEGSELSDLMTGVELRQGEGVIFRGGIWFQDGYPWLVREDGTYENMDVFTVTNGIEVTDGSGNVIDPIAPSPFTVVDLMAGPELTHKGTWAAWLCGVLVCGVAAGTILFADELFRWQLRFLIRNPDSAQPSDWEIASRYMIWIFLVISALVIFIAGSG